MTLKLADFGLCLNLREERSVTRAGTIDYMVRGVQGVGGWVWNKPRDLCVPAFLSMPVTSSPPGCDVSSPSSPSSHYALPSLAPFLPSPRGHHRPLIRLALSPPTLPHLPSRPPRC